MATQVVILRAVRSFAPHLARLKNAWMVFFNGLLNPLGVDLGVGRVLTSREMRTIERAAAGQATFERDFFSRSPRLFDEQPPLVECVLEELAVKSCHIEAQRVFGIGRRLSAPRRSARPG